MNKELTAKEKRILWCVLNQAQDIGLRTTASLLKTFESNSIPHTETMKVVDDWLKQTVDEYDTINILKQKLCGDE
jgi:hypothetical protein